MNAISRIARFAFIVSLAIPVVCRAQYVTSNVLRRTLLIQAIPGETASAFTIEVDGRQYLITAKHVVSTFTDGAQSTIEIMTKNGWSPLKVTVFKCDDPVDVAVLVPPTQITVDYPLEPSSKELAVGQDAYFVGFPYGLEHATTYTAMSTVFGLVKRATVAQFDSMPQINAQRIILDGINNQGFSGSPLVFRDLSQPGLVFKVAGVIVNYEAQLSPVFKPVQIREQDITPTDLAQELIVHSSDGKVYRLQNTGEVVKSNTGIATAWDIGTAVALIRQHPIGPNVSDSFTGG